MTSSNLGLHHQQTRKGLHKNLETYPHKDKQKNMVDKFVYIAGILTPFATIPQVLNIWINKSATDVSIFTWMPYLIFAAIWLWYGILHKEKPIIVLNLGLVIVNIFVVLGIIMYG